MILTKFGNNLNNRPVCWRSNLGNIMQKLIDIYIYVYAYIPSDKHTQKMNPTYTHIVSWYDFLFVTLIYEKCYFSFFRYPWKRPLMATEYCIFECQILNSFIERHFDYFDFTNKIWRKLSAVIFNKLQLWCFFKIDFIKDHYYLYR